MKLSDTGNGNSKVRKTQKLGGAIRLAQLSMYPDNIICPGSKAAGCMEACLKDAGLANVYDSVNEARRRKTEFFKNDESRFLEQLRRELSNFLKLCKKNGVVGWVRLNTISDIAYETFGIPQEFPELNFYDYTKRAARLLKTPDNYNLMFSYSGAPKYHNQVLKAFDTGVPIAAVFRGSMPNIFLGRRVINGDRSDLINLKSPGKIIGLKAKGPALIPNESNKLFVIDENNRETFENRFFKKIPVIQTIPEWASEYE